MKFADNHKEIGFKEQFTEPHFIFKERKLNSNQTKKCLMYKYEIHCTMTKHTAKFVFMEPLIGCNLNQIIFP